MQKQRWNTRVEKFAARAAAELTKTSNEAAATLAFLNAEHSKSLERKCLNQLLCVFCCLDLWPPLSEDKAYSQWLAAHTREAKKPTVAEKAAVLDAKDEVLDAADKMKAMLAAERNRKL